MISNTILNVAMQQGTMDLEMAGMIGSVLAMIMGALLLGSIIAIILYVYIALVFQTIAKKLNYDKPWLAWIPIANMFLLPILAKKHWAMGFLFLVPIVGAVFYFIWLWKIFELRKYPGWLSLTPILAIIPFVNVIAIPGFLVILGLVAWKDRN